jgi:hypothetical protein
LDEFQGISGHKIDEVANLAQRWDREYTYHEAEEGSGGHFDNGREEG